MNEPIGRRGPYEAERARTHAAATDCNACPGRDFLGELVSAMEQFSEPRLKQLSTGRRSNG